MAVDRGAHDAGRHAGVTGPDGRAQAEKAHGDGWRPTAVALPFGQPVGGQRVRGRRRANRADGSVRAAFGPAVRGVLAGAARVAGPRGRRIGSVRLRRP